MTLPLTVTFFLKGIGLQTLSFISKEREQPNKHFDTTFIKIGYYKISGFEDMKVLRFNNGHQWWPPFCLASHVTKKEKCLFTVVDLLFTFENRSV